jgi:hypothetical protein
MQKQLYTKASRVCDWTMDGKDRMPFLALVPVVSLILLI